MSRYTIPDDVVRSMNDPAAVPPPEFQIRPVVRYVITRYFHASPMDNLPASSEVLAEVDNERHAEELVAALRAAAKIESL